LGLDSYIKSIKSGPDPLSAREERVANPKQLAEHSMRLALSIASKHFRSDEEYNVDLLSTAINALVRQAQTFDPEKGRFSTVATKAIQRSIGVYKKKEFQVMIGYSISDHEKFNNSLTTYIEGASGSVQASQLDDLCESDEEYAVRRSLLILSDRPRKAIIQRYLIGRDPQDLANSMNITRDQLDRLCQRAIQRMRKEVGDRI
jgi:RNA polymerase sigma factor (sigma-70 family)